MGQQQMERPRPALQQMTRPGVLDRERPSAQGPRVPERPSWKPLLASAGATVLLIALLAGLLVAQANRRPPRVASVPTATASAAATPAVDQWQSVDGYTHVGGLVLAPSDGHVAYQNLLNSSKTSPTTVTLARTHDAGATWQPLRLPALLQTVDPNNYDLPPTIAVSPLNANMVYLTAGGRMTSCPSGVQPSGQDCYVQFYSSDGGANWHELHLLVSGLLGAARAQGARLWALISPPFVAQDTSAPAGRLARSADGGITWVLADSGLPPSVGIGDFAPSPAGSSVFIVTDRADRFNAGVCQGCMPPPDYKLWRSDDLGAHWAQQSSLPYQSVARIAVAPSGSGANPTVYLEAITDTQGTLALVASTDGGRDWAPSPTSGLATGSIQMEGTLSVLADGSALLIFSSDGSPSLHTFYAYKSGDADWRPVAPQLTSLVVQPPLVGAPNPDGSQTLTLLYQDQDGNRVATYSVR